jgi:hypothetical protein
MRLRNGRWVTQSTPAITGASYGTGVSCWQTGCLAVAGTNSPNTEYAQQTIAEYWNGRKWALQSPVGSGDPANSGAVWNAVQCNSASNCVAVGAWADGSVTETPSTLISTWNGTSWSQQTSPDPGSSANQLNAISCSSDLSTCTAAGWAYPDPLVIRNE